MVSADREPGLDALRAFAVLLVLFAHGGWFLYAAFPHFDLHAVTGWIRTDLDIEDQVQRQEHREHADRFLPEMSALVDGDVHRALGVVLLVLGPEPDPAMLTAMQPAVGRGRR